MNSIVALVIFVLSLVITHMITSRYIYIGTSEGIFAKKFKIWVVVIFALLLLAQGLHLVNADDISDQENKKMSQEENRKVNKYQEKQISGEQDDMTSEDNSEDFGEYDENSDDEDYIDDYDKSSDYEDYADDYDEGSDDNSYDESDNSDASEYILPDSATEKLKKSDLEGLSKKELRIARNEIYARHGRRFNDKTLQAYFDSQEWYEGTIPADEFSEDVLNSIEKKNAAFIKQFE